MRRSMLTLMLSLSIAPAMAGTPQINVGSMYDYLPADASNLLKRVRNSGDATAFVRVEISQVHYAADGSSTETAVDAAALAGNVADAHGLIASPGRMIIPAKGQQATRLVYRGSRDVEQYYRVRFIPVVPDGREFALTEEEIAQYKGSLSAKVNVFTGYGTLMFVAPADAHYQTAVDDLPAGTRLRNDGNATVVLDNLRQCPVDKEQRCAPGIRVHLRPGQSHTVARQAGQYQRLELVEGSTRRPLDLHD